MILGGCGVQDNMGFEKVTDIYLSREWRGPAVFMCHWSGAGYPNWGSPVNYSNMGNSWLPVPVPVPVEAKQVHIMGMFVGGVLPNKTSFMMHVDFADPALPRPSAGDDWSGNGGQGDIYCDFQTPGVRQSLGPLWLPCKDSKILLRWKLEPAAGYTDGAWGLNLWCEGYAT